MPIQPLPSAVAAQIKATSAVVSLSHVVLGLLENALDAHATRINVFVDFPRGGCVIEDDGDGIAPLDFAEGGGLAKRFHTDKYGDRNALGSSGAFLASLAAVSLLTIVSRHHQYRLPNALIIHHARVLQRELPAEARHRLAAAHGTRVTVRNLFGNLPVRVKQRALVADQVAEQRKQWSMLKRDIARLLLAWDGSTSLKVRDAENALMFSFAPSTFAAERQSHQGLASGCAPTSARLSRILGILTQADYITISDWRSWIPVSASTPALTIKGAISLEPSPNKHVQFISLGIRALSDDSSHSELYDHVNRIFSLSSFGTITEDVKNEDEKSRRESDKRFKYDGYTLRQLKTRKGVDRFPMFHLRVQLMETKGRSIPSADPLSSGFETSLPAILDLISAMVTQWLSVHHFRPMQLRKKITVEPETVTASTSSAITDRITSQCLDLQQGDNRQSGREDVEIEPSLPHCSTRHPLSTKASNEVPRITGCQVFKDWSRIKTGKAKYFDEYLDAENAKHSGTGWSRSVINRLGTRLQLQPPSVPRGAFTSSANASGRQSNSDEDDRNGKLHSALEPAANNDMEDETMFWADPVTKKTCLLNTRTGCVVPQVPPIVRINSAPSASVQQQREQTPSLRLPPRNAPRTAEATPWLNSFLTTWSNPTFETQQEVIRNVFIQDFHDDIGVGDGNRRCLNQTAFGITSNGKAVAHSISKGDLQSAQVIAQVDEKFVLVKVRPNTPDALLILVDQHAADERIQVERLYAELCQLASLDSAFPPNRSNLGYTSRVVTTILEKPIHFSISAQEYVHFTTHAARFAAWGILYDSSTSDPPSSAIIPPSSSRPRTSTAPITPRLTVTALPPAISERCKSDPQLLISMLRTSVWYFVESPHLAPLPPSPSNTISTVTPQTQSQEPAWPVELASAPHPLLELLNSRACRSAIMFNDVLSLAQCENLVQRLAACVFPFMCAHGRPSLVAICGVGVDTGKETVDKAYGEQIELAGADVGSKEEGSFVEAWQRWRGDADGGT